MKQEEVIIPLHELHEESLNFFNDGEVGENKVENEQNSSGDDSPGIQMIYNTDDAFVAESELMLQQIEA